MLKRVLTFIAPHGLVLMRQRVREERSRVAAEVARNAYHAERHERLEAVKMAPDGAASCVGSDYEDLIRFLIRRGLSDHHVREGSIPLASLKFISDEVIATFGSGRPLRALHVGNFVGVSVAFLTAVLVQKHPQSLVVSVDPNLPHRGIHNPQSHVLALLSACGLQSNSLVLTGYSGKKSVSNDATVFAGYDPIKEFVNESATEDTLANLARLCPSAFDLVFLDGNHEASYLLNEIRQILPLLRPSGCVVIDDVDAAWPEIRDVFRRISEFGLEPIKANGRVGVARYYPPSRVKS